MSIEKRIEALEAAHARSADTSSGAGEHLGFDFAKRALDALARIRRAPIDAEWWRYRVEKLEGESPVTVAAHVAALAALDHPDEEAAREILADLERERGLDPDRHEKLISGFAVLVGRARQRDEDGV